MRDGCIRKLDPRILNKDKADLVFNEINKTDLPVMYSIVFWCPFSVSPDF